MQKSSESIRLNKKITISVDAKLGVLLPYAKLCQIMQDCMEEGEKDHEKDGWKKQTVRTHLNRAEAHRLTGMFYPNDIHKEDHIVHAFVRHAMALIKRDGLI